jgi:flagellar biosynthesis protein FlhA
MFDESRFEYVVKSCPSENTEELEELLNKMSVDGWELYSLNEAEGEEGFQYNCIFSRQASDSYEEDDDIAQVGHFKSRMEKLFHYKDDPSEQAKSLQEQLRQKNERINEIKQLLDSNSIDIDRESLNQEISEKLAERNIIKNKFTDILSPANMYERINQDILTIVVSDELVDLIDNEKNGELIIDSVRLRQVLTDKLGYIIPAIRFISSDEMPENQYSIKVRKLKALSGIAYPGYRQFNQGQANIERKPRGAIDCINPVTGQKVFWIEEEKTKSYWDKGLTPSQVITRHLDFVVCKYIEEILSYGEILNYISLLGEENLFLAEELIQGSLSLGDLRYIFAKLIREKVSIKDIVFVFEKLNDLMKAEYNNDQLVDNLRILMGRQICSDIADSNNYIYGIIPSSEQNAKLKKALDKKNKGKNFIRNNDIKEFVKFVCEKVKNCEYDISNIAIIVKPDLRLPVFNLFEQVITDLRVISEDEITEEFNIEVL